MLSRFPVIFLVFACLAAVIGPLRAARAETKTLPIVLELTGMR